MMLFAGRAADYQASLRTSLQQKEDNPKPQILNPKPKTLNHKPVLNSIRSFCEGCWIWVASRRFA